MFTGFPRGHVRSSDPESSLQLSTSSHNQKAVIRGGSKTGTQLSPKFVTAFNTFNKAFNWLHLKNKCVRKSELMVPINLPLKSLTTFSSNLRLLHFFLLLLQSSAT